MYRWNLQLCILLIAVQAGLIGDAFASEGAEHHSEQRHEYHRNTLSGFFGITGEDHRERAGTIAIEHERRFNERWGLAAGVEHAFGDLDFTVFTVPVVFHTGNWALYAGPGVEKPDDHGSEFLFRVGVGYEFEKGNLRSHH